MQMSQQLMYISLQFINRTHTIIMVIISTNAFSMCSCLFTHPRTCLCSQGARQVTALDSEDMYQQLLKNVQIFTQNLSKPQK